MSSTTAPPETRHHVNYEKAKQQASRGPMLRRFKRTNKDGSGSSLKMVYCPRWANNETERQERQVQIEKLKAAGFREVHQS